MATRNGPKIDKFLLEEERYSMDTEVITRAYLQNLPEERKQAKIKTKIVPLLQTIVRVAGEGCTSYLFEVISGSLYLESRQIFDKRGAAVGYGGPSYPLLEEGITIEDIIEALKKKFIDSSVTYTETWMDTSANTRTLKKGILIDWS